MAVSRCGWATNDPLYIAYHDREWGSPLHDDRGLFELLILEGAQAGLSWITILRRRESYRRAFDDFEPSKIAGYGERKLAELLDNPGIIRNRLKIEAAVVNAKAFIEVQRHFGSFDTYILAVRQSHTCAKCKGGHARHSKLLQRIGCDEQGFEKARLQVRRDNDLLRFYAGDWDGQ
jgi:DNA-3-methyladenine glycosylase I